MSIQSKHDNGPVAGSMGIPSGDFLAMVRAALGREDAAPVEPYAPLSDDLAALESQAEAVRERIAGELPGLVTRMVDTAALRGWNVARCGGVEDALDYVVSLAGRLGASSVARSEQAVFDVAPVDRALAGVGALCWRRSRKARAGRPSGGRWRVCRGIPERITRRRTGFGHRAAAQGLSRLARGCRRTARGIVGRRTLPGTLDDLFQLRRWSFTGNGGAVRRRHGSYLNFITGPSRTADMSRPSWWGAWAEGSSLVMLSRSSEMPMRVGFIQYRRQMLEQQLAELTDVFPTLGIEKAILTGDAVSGDYSPASTLDFIFVQETDRPFGRRADFFSYHLDAQVGITSQVYTPAEFEELQETLPALYAAVKQGRMVFDA